MNISGEIEIVENGHPLLRAKNRITNLGVRLLAKALIDGRVEIAKVILGTGRTAPSRQDAELESPLPFTFQIIRKDIEEIEPGRVGAIYVAMIETAESSGFQFSEAGLVGTDPDTGEDVLVARTAFPEKTKRPYNEYYFYWKIKLSIV